MYILHYYLEKGIMPENILNLSPLEKEFFAASIEVTADEVTEATKDTKKVVKNNGK